MSSVYTRSTITSTVLNSFPQPPMEAYPIRRSVSDQQRRKPVASYYIVNGRPPAPPASVVIGGSRTRHRKNSSMDGYVVPPSNGVSYIPSNAIRSLPVPPIPVRQKSISYSSPTPVAPLRISTTPRRPPPTTQYPGIPPSPRPLSFRPKSTFSDYAPPPLPDLSLTPLSPSSARSNISRSSSLGSRKNRLTVINNSTIYTREYPAPPQTPRFPNPEVMQLGKRQEVEKTGKSMNLRWEQVGRTPDSKAVLQSSKPSKARSNSNSVSTPKTPKVQHPIINLPPPPSYKGFRGFLRRLGLIRKTPEERRDLDYLCKKYQIDRSKGYSRKMYYARQGFETSMHGSPLWT